MVISMGMVITLKDLNGQGNSIDIIFWEAYKQLGLLKSILKAYQYYGIVLKW